MDVWMMSLGIKTFIETSNGGCLHGNCKNNCGVCGQLHSEFHPIVIFLKSSSVRVRNFGCGLIPAQKEMPG
jgi:hypothetical protein